MRFNEIITESAGARLKDLAKISTNMPDADFWLIRKGSDKTVGKPVTEFDPSRIGVKVVRTDVLDPKYLYYVMMNLHNQGQFARIANGTTNLVNITVNDIANIPLGQQGVNESSSQQDAINTLLKKHGWAVGRIEGDLAFTWEGKSYRFQGERMRITSPNGQSMTVIWGKQPNWQGRTGECSFAQAVQNKYITFDLPIWQELDRGKINDSQAIQKFKNENERQAIEALNKGI